MGNGGGTVASVLSVNLVPLLVVVNSSVGCSTLLLPTFNAPVGGDDVIGVVVVAAAVPILVAVVLLAALLMCVCVVRVLATIVWPPLALAAVYSFSV